MRLLVLSWFQIIVFLLGLTLRVLLDHGCVAEQSKAPARKRRRHGRGNGPFGHTSILSDDGIAAFGFLRIFMT